MAKGRVKTQPRATTRPKAQVPPQVQASPTGPVLPETPPTTATRLTTQTSTDTCVSLGIDLGTSRSAIVTSNGVRHAIESYVGWPVDAIARTVVPKPILIGREALDHRLMLDLRRPLEAGYIKEGSDKDVAAVRELLRYLLTRAGIEPDDPHRPTVRAVVGVPACALAGKHQLLRNAVTGLVDHVKLVPEPFAVAYGLEALRHTLVIDIGAGTTDFCVLHGRYPTDEELQTVAMAGDTVDTELATLVHARYPDAQVSIHMARAWKEQWGFVGEAPHRVQVTVPIQGLPTQVDITEEMRRACELLLPPLTHAMRELLGRVEPEYQAQVRANIILAGGSSQLVGLRDSLHQALAHVGGGQVAVVVDPDFAGAVGGLALAVEADEADWDVLVP